MADEKVPKILIVDDDPLTASWMRGLLEQEGYGVIVAPTGSEGLERVRAEAPALVLLDKADIETELGVPVAITIPYDGEQVPLTTNARVPYLERHGDSVTGMALRELERLTVERSMKSDEALAAHRP